MLTKCSAPFQELRRKQVGGAPLCGALTGFARASELANWETGMIQLYTWKTPNGRKAAIMLEEIGLPYRVHAVDLTADEQHAQAFLAISPNNKIPAIVDEAAGRGSQPLFESGAILSYLAEKSGMLLAPSGPARWSVLEWLYWSIGGLGPMLGQLNFYAVRSDEKAPLAIDRFRKEGERLLRVLETRLSDQLYVGGADYSIADVASYPWVEEARVVMAEPLGKAFAASPAIADWLARVGERPAVQKGMRILEA